jgi:hypothetical protein
VRLRPDRSLPRSSPAIVVIVVMVGLGQRPLAKGGGQNGESKVIGVPFVPSEKRTSATTTTSTSYSDSVTSVTP